MKVLGIIPARGGSKGVPGKNIRPLGGTPLIVYTIRAAAASRLARCIVSTDSAEIAEVAKAHGAEVPFLRPADLATDAANAIPVLQHAYRHLRDECGESFEAAMMLQPTTPFRRVEDINRAIEILEKTGADSVISVIESDRHPARMKYLEGDRLIDPPFCEAYENQPRQELRPMYLRSGAIYLSRIETLERNSIKGNDSRALIVPNTTAVNIDSLDDFEYAEWLQQTDKA
jgi:CMP-N-acetylneuraminic acid synthetase